MVIKPTASYYQQILKAFLISEPENSISFVAAHPDYDLFR